MATGFAEETLSDDWKNVNSTSMIENCETSAWGRALGNLGIGIDTSVASAEEVETSINRQEQMYYLHSSSIIKGLRILQPHSYRTGGN